MSFNFEIQRKKPKTQRKFWHFCLCMKPSPKVIRDSNITGSNVTNKKLTSRKICPSYNEWMIIGWR